MIPTKTINLDFWRHPTDILHLVQGEADGRKVQFKITDNGSVADLTGFIAIFAIKKPDGNIVVNSATITEAESGIVETTISSQVVTTAGNAHAELHLMKEGQLSKSFRIVTKVAPGVDIDGIAPSVSEFNALQTLIGQAETVISIADTELWPEVVANAQYFSDLAGDGRTTETVKGNADNIEAFKTDYATLTGVEDQSVTINMLEDVVYKYGSNLYDKSLAVDNVNLPMNPATWNNTKTLVEQSGGIFSGLSPITIGTFIASNGYANFYVGNLFFFDENRNAVCAVTRALSAYGSWPVDNTKVLRTSQTSIFQVLDESIKYVAWYMHGNGFGVAHTTEEFEEIKNVAAINKGTVKLDYEPYKKSAYISKNVIEDINPLIGKIALFSGDSICAGSNYNGGYPTLIAERNNMTCINYGRDGSRITVTAQDNGDSISERIATMQANADYIILQGGVNDAYAGLYVPDTLPDTYNESPDAAYFVGAMEKMLRDAISKWRGKKIGFILTHQIFTLDASQVSNSRPLWKYLDLAQQICRKYSVPTLDLFHESGLCGAIPEINSTYFHNGDYCHPNLKGYEVITPKIEAWMKTL